MNHLRKAPLLPFCGWSPPRLQTTAVGSVKGQDIRMVERGGRRSTEAASTRPGLTQQDGAEAGRQCRFPHPAVRSHLLESIVPLMTWCHVVILFGIWDSHVQKWATTYQGVLFCFCVRECSEQWREHAGSPEADSVHWFTFGQIFPQQKKFVT